MIKCPNCGEESIDGALLCKNCGTYFQSSSHLSTDPLEDIEEFQEPSKFATPTFDTAPLGATLVLRDEKDERELVIPRKLTSALLGRSDQLAGLTVDIELADPGGKPHGVSRRHARVRFVNERYLLEDMESLNGTFLNGRKLVPFIPEVLRDGDKVRFGSVTYVATLKPPAQSSDDASESD